MTSGPSLILPDPVVLDLRREGRAVHDVPVAFMTSTLDRSGVNRRDVWATLDLSLAHWAPMIGDPSSSAFLVPSSSGQVHSLHPRTESGTKCWVKEAYRAREVERAKGDAGVWLAEVQYRADRARRHVMVPVDRMRPYYEGSFGDDETFRVAKEMPAWASRGGVTIEKVRAVLVDGGPRWRLDLVAGDVWRRPRGGVEGVSGPVVDAGGREAGRV